ncbi:hypothetical protein GINT2_001199 [Glugoides intestinalis]
MSCAPRSPRPCTIENIYFKTEDNRTIGAYLIYDNTREDRGQKKFFIFCHGNGANRYSYTTSYNLTDNLLNYPDAVFLILDYGGFGDAEGEFEIDKVNLDVKAAFEFINKRNNMVRRDIKLIGHSFGCAVALEYCKYISTDDTEYSDFYKPSKVILLTPFATTLTILKKNPIYRVLSFLFPTLDRNIKTQFFYDNLENIKHAGNNFVVLHGKKDSLIPYTESESIMANSERKGIFLFFPEKGHFNILECFGTFCDMDPRGEENESETLRYLGVSTSDSLDHEPLKWGKGFSGMGEHSGHGNHVFPTSHSEDHEFGSTVRGSLRQEDHRFPTSHSEDHEFGSTVRGSLRQEDHRFPTSHSEDHEFGSTVRGSLRQEDHRFPTSHSEDHEFGSTVRGSLRQEDHVFPTSHSEDHEFGSTVRGSLRQEDHRFPTSHSEDQNLNFTENVHEEQGNQEFGSEEVQNSRNHNSSFTAFHSEKRENDREEEEQTDHNIFYWASSSVFQALKNLLSTGKRQDQRDHRNVSSSSGSQEYIELQSFV